MAPGKSFAGARFTPTSVAWAESITAISNSKGVPKSSSVVGSGLAARRRAKIAVRWSSFMGRRPGRGQTGDCRAPVRPPPGTSRRRQQVPHASHQRFHLPNRGRTVDGLGVFRKRRVAVLHGERVELRQGGVLGDGSVPRSDDIDEFAEIVCQGPIGR